MTDRPVETHTPRAEALPPLTPQDAAPEPSLADQLGALLHLLAGSDVEQLDVQHARARFVIRRDLSGNGSAAPVQPFEQEPVGRSDTFVITAPLVGVFRRSTGGPGEAALEPGDVVTAGQVVGAVEAMGMLNRIQSDRAGVVDDVLVREGQPVEYGQPLLAIREP